VSYLSKEDEYRHQVLLVSIQTELSLGTKHYNKKGELLETWQAVVRTLLDEGGIAKVVPTPERAHLFVTEEEGTN
jgi:hypothetical protein